MSAAAELFQHLDQLVGVDTPVTDANVEQVIAEVRDVNENVASYLRAASRMTWVASMIEGGVKSNSVAEKCLITCDVRTLPHQGRRLRAKRAGETARRSQRRQSRGHRDGGLERVNVRPRVRGPRHERHARRYRQSETSPSCRA